jgi:Secretion system C-terminal sorting domain
MKRILLLTVFMFVSMFGFSQSFSISNVYISGDPLFFLEGHARITNNSSSTKNMLVQKTVNNLFPGHHSYFCLVQCYDTSTVLALDTLAMPALTTTGTGNLPGFFADLETNSASGISIVSYCFYDAFNVSDSACVEYVYDATTGLTDLSGKNYVSKAYPNPAIDNTTIYYNLARATRNSQIKIFNMLGAEVRTYNIADSKGTLKIPVSGLKPGVYFYSLMADGKNAATGKFMVTRN